MTPYTYLIGWTKLGKYYYGVRYGKKCHPDELWKSYFTSSRYVSSFRAKHGEPDLIQVRKTFNSREAACLHEEKVLRRLDCAGRKDFLNRANGKAIPVELSTKWGESNGMYGRKHSSETRAKMKKKHKMPVNYSEIARQRAIGRSGAKNANFIGYISTPNGVFESLKQASIENDLTMGQIHYRIHNPKYNDYIRVNRKEG